MTEQQPQHEWSTMLAARRQLIGMVHIGALPGTPGHRVPLKASIEQAVSEAVILADAGFDAVMVENMHDTPYVHGDRLGPEITAAMTAAAGAIRAAIPVPLGIQILSGGSRQALAVALASGASFIRCENFVFSHVADEGLLAEAEAGPLLRYRRSIGAEHIGIFCDIKKKHASHAMTADISIADAVEAAAFFCADAAIITGSHTGRAASSTDIESAAGASALPVIVGSGATAESLPGLYEHASAVIVGSAIKQGRHWFNAVDAQHAAEFVRVRDSLRTT